MASRSYRIIEHTADIGFEVTAESLEQVFEAAATAFFEIMLSIDFAAENKPETIVVKGGDLDELLVNFLEEFLYLYDAKGLVCTKIKVESITDTAISANAWLQEFDDQRDQELLGVKAVTYHQLFIGHTEKGWSARVFLDI